MSKNSQPDGAPNWDYVERKVRKRTFGVLTTVDGRNRPHSTGILYGVAPPTSPFALYFLTVESYAKVRNARANPRVSLTIPLPHRILSFIPARASRSAVTPTSPHSTTRTPAGRSSSRGSSGTSSTGCPT